MPRLESWATRRESSVSPSHGWSAAGAPSASAAVATSTADEPGTGGTARRARTGRPDDISFTALTARQGTRGASSSIRLTQSLPTTAGS